jgi:adenylate cyclase
MGEFTKSLYHQEQVVALFDPQQHYTLVYTHSLDPKNHSLSYISLIFWFLGFPDQAMQKEQEALSWAYELSHSNSTAHGLFFSAFLNILLRNTDGVCERAEELIQISSEKKFKTFIHLGKCMRSWRETIYENKQLKNSEIRQILTAAHETGTLITTQFLRALIAEMCLKIGQPDEGLQAVREGQNVVDTTGGRLLEAELYRFKGELLLAKSKRNQSEAESCFKKAISVAQRQQAKSLELRASMSLSRLWQGQGKQEEARGLLSEIYGWFTEGFDTADLKDAKALLEELF